MTTDKSKFVSEEERNIHFIDSVLDVFYGVTPKSELENISLDSSQEDLYKDQSAAPVQKRRSVKDKKGFWDSYVGDMIERFGAGAAEFGGSFWSALDKFDNFYAKYDYNHSVLRALQELRLKAQHPDRDFKSFWDREAKNAYGYADVLRGRSDRYNEKDFIDLWGEGKYGDMVGEVFLTATESLAQSIPALMGGNVGLGVMGASSGVRKYDQLDEMDETKDMSEYAKVINAVSTGTFEALTERLGDVEVGKMLKRLYLNKGKDFAEKEVKSGLVGWFENMYKKHGILFAPVAEGVEEVAQQISENITDWCTGVTDEWKPMENTFESFVYGLGGGMQFSAMATPAYYRNQFKKKEAKKNFTKAEQVLNEVFDTVPDLELFKDGIKVMNRAEQVEVINSMLADESITDEQRKAVIDFTEASNVYNEYFTPEAKQKEFEAKRELLFQAEIKNLSNQLKTVTHESGNIITVEVSGKENGVALVSGNLVTKEDKGNLLVDIEKSDEKLYYKDEDGKVQVISPSQITKIVAIENTNDIIEQFKNEVVLENIEETEEESISEVENGDTVSFVNEDGQTVKAVITDSSNPEFVFTEQGQAIKRDDIIDVVKDSAVVENVPTEQNVPISENQNEVNNQAETFEIDEDISATLLPDKSGYVLNKQFPQSEIQKGENLVKKLNEDYKDEGLLFSLERLPKVDVNNRFEKPLYGVIAKEVEVIPSNNESLVKVPVETIDKPVKENKEKDVVSDKIFVVGVPPLEEKLKNKPESKKEVKESTSLDDVSETQPISPPKEVSNPKERIKSEKKEVKSTLSKEFGADNILVSREEYEKLKQEWKELTRGQLNMGVNPRLFTVGTQMALFHLEGGALKFKDFVKSMLDDIGESIKPYLKGIYEGARRMPGMEDLSKEMDSTEYVDGFDLESLNKETKEVDNYITKIFNKDYYINEIEHESPNIVVAQYVKKDVTKFVKALNEQLEWEFHKDKKGKIEYCQTNIAPVGGDVHFKLWKPNSDVGLQFKIKVIEDNSFDFYFYDANARIDIIHKSGKTLSQSYNVINLLSPLDELSFLIENVAKRYIDEEYILPPIQKLISENHLEGKDLLEKRYSLKEHTVREIEDLMDKDFTDFAKTINTELGWEFEKDSNGNVVYCSISANAFMSNIRLFKPKSNFGIQLFFMNSIDGDIFKIDNSIHYRGILKNDKSGAMNMKETLLDVSLEDLKYLINQEVERFEREFKQKQYFDKRDNILGQDLYDKVYHTKDDNHTIPVKELQNQIGKDIIEFAENLNSVLGWELNELDINKIFSHESVTDHAKVIFWKPNTDFGIDVIFNSPTDRMGNIKFNDEFSWAVVHKNDEKFPVLPRFQKIKTSIYELSSIFEDAVDKYLIENKNEYDTRTVSNRRSNNKVELPDGVQPRMGMGNVRERYSERLPKQDSERSVSDGERITSERDVRNDDSGDNQRNVVVSSERNGGLRDDERGTGETRELSRGVHLLNTNNFYLPENSPSPVPNGQITKIRANIEAIRLIKHLEQEKRQPTDKEKKILAAFSGWGGLADVLNTTKYYESNWREKYLELHDEIKSLLSPEEFTAAVNSTINAHYTSIEVVRNLWSLAEHLGFKGGRVLEPAMGTGNFFAAMPQYLANNSSLLGYELDSITGKISKFLYPDANIKVTGYENSIERDLDLVITNVPFGQIAPYDKKNKDLSSFSLHNYFIAKGLKALKPKGLGIFITSMSSLDNGASAKFREWVSNSKQGNADFIGAIRLPNTAFLKNAGTEVTTDILVFQKRDSETASKYDKPFRHSVPFKETVDSIGNPTSIFVNEYFKRNPHMMLGEIKLAYQAKKGGLYTKDEVTLDAHPDSNLAELVQEAIHSFEPDLVSGEVYLTEQKMAKSNEEDVEGSLLYRDGELWEVVNGSLTTPVWSNQTITDKRKKKVTKKEVARNYLDIRETIDSLVDAEIKDSENIEELRAKLNKVYDSFISRFGHFHKNTKLNFLRDSDVHYFTVASLEKVKKYVVEENGKFIDKIDVLKSDIFLNRISFPTTEPTTATNLDDAINISIAFKNSLDIAYMSKLLNQSEEEVKQNLLDEGKAFVNPTTGLLEDSETYLSGFVRQKLQEAENAAESDATFKKNVEELKKVIPEDIPASQIKFRLGSIFIPSKVYEQFCLDKFQVGARVMYRKEINSFIVDKKTNRSNEANKTSYGTNRIDGIGLFEKGINMQSPVIMDYYWEDNKKKSKKNEEETTAAQNKLIDIQNDFENYVLDNELYLNDIAKIYNEQYNSYVEKRFQEPYFKHFPNANPQITLYNHQKKAVGRTLKDSTLLAHQVGSGKTFTLITTAMEMRRLNIAKKPMIVVQNSTIEQFAASFKTLYPSAKILCPTPNMMDNTQRVRLLNMITYGDFDAVIVPQSFLSKIPDSPERIESYLNEQRESLQKLLIEIDADTDKTLWHQIKAQLKSIEDQLEKASETEKPERVKDKARKNLSIEKKVRKQADRDVDNTRTFEQMGVDALLIDEAHAYKRLGLVTKLSNVKGIDTAGSKRALSTFLKVRYIQERNNGRNVVFATGTPVSNTMAEVWTMMRYIAPDVLEQYNMSLFDEFASTFGNIEPSLEYTAAGNFKIVDRFKSFNNVPELLKAFRSKTDVVLSEDVKEFQDSNSIPKIKNNEFTQIIIPQSEALKDVMRSIKKTLQEWEKLKGAEKRKNRHIPLVCFNKAKQAAIDLRLLNPRNYDDPGSKVNRSITEILRIYRETEEYKGTQMVFCDMYQSPEKVSPVRFNLYKDIKQKLIDAGVPESEVAIINDYGEKTREKLFNDVNEGKVRVLIGGTEKMGVGVNVQRLLAALHHLDAPARPMDFEQRNGRIIRQGNLHAQWGKPIEVLTYGVEKTLDATAYQRLLIKQSFINQIMKGQITGREMEDFAAEDSPTDMNFAQMRSTLTGNPHAILHTQKSFELKKLLTSKKTFEKRKEDLKYELKHKHTLVEHYKNEKDLYRELEEIKDKYFPENKITSIDIDDKVYTEKLSEELDNYLDKIIKIYQSNNHKNKAYIYLNKLPIPLRFGIRIHALGIEINYVLRFDNISDVEITSSIQSGQGLISSINTNLKNFGKRKEDILEREKKNLEAIKILEIEVEKEFNKDDKITELEKEVAELEKLMQEEEKEDEDNNRNKGELITKDDILNILNSDDLEIEVVTRERIPIYDYLVPLREYEKSNYKRQIEAFSKSLNVAVKTVDNRFELPDNVIKVLRDNMRYSGVYVPSSGEVYVILNEVLDEVDLQRTLLHEVIGHKGLRGLLGNNLNEFSNRVLNSLDIDSRKELLQRFNKNKVRAAQEYVAEFAENYTDVSAWMRVKGFLKEIFRKLGIDLKLTDKDLQYLLWKGKNRLKNSTSALEAIDIVSGDLNLYREAEESYFKSGTSVKIDITMVDRTKLNNRIASRSFKFVESYQDRMLALKEYQELIEKKIGKKLPDYMDAYLYENTLASKNTYEFEFFLNNFLKPLTKSISELEKQGLSRNTIEDYVMVKHGIERNLHFRQKLLEQWENKQKQKLESIKDGISEDEYKGSLKLIEKKKKKYEKSLKKRDFSGISGILNERNIDFDDAHTFLDEIEGKYNMSSLWDAIKRCTDFSLEKWFKSSMIDKKTYTQIKEMYQNYVPLRGFDETIASDVYEYFLHEESSFSNPMKTAHGRRSKADDPFAYIVSMAQSSIIGGNKNLMKLHLLRLAQNYPTELLDAHKMWYQLSGVDENGNPAYEMVYPEYSEDYETYRENIEAFNERMSELEEVGEAYRSKASLNVGLRLLHDEPKEHEVRVRLNGENYVILVHGNPRIAQAINGLNDEDRQKNKVLNTIRWMNRQMAANFTTRNPAFVASNMTRDIIYASTALSVKEGNKYRNQFWRNIPRASAAIYRYLNNKSKFTNKEDAAFREFLQHGGETGYTALYNIEKFKKMIDSEVKAESRSRLKRSSLTVLDFFAACNRWAEDLSRFSTFLTSRQMGRSVLQSVNDAKEVTVNFNRKGSGNQGAQVCKSMYLFFNAAVQSLQNGYGLYQKNPKGAIAALASYSFVGALVPLFLMAMGGDDALKEYMSLPDYVRKNNLCLYLGKNRGFVTLPLPIELRAFFGLGDSFFGYASGETDGFTACGDVIMGMTDLLPLNPVGGETPFLPDALKPISQSYYSNKSFTGRPIAKITPYNGYVPEYQKVYKNTGKFYVKSSEVLNELTGGDYATKGAWDEAGAVLADLLGMNVNLSNPAAFQHLIESYIGGMFKTVNQTFKLIEDGVTGEEVEARNLPILNRFYNSGSKYGYQSKLNEKYFKALDELQEIQSRMRRYKDAMSNGEMDLEDAIERFSNLVDEGDYLKAEIIKMYQKEINKIGQYLQTGGLSNEEQDNLLEEQFVLKEMMLNELKDLKKRK